MPVHQWMVKHIYIPVKTKWHKKWLGLLVCFGISAVFHEILIAVPLHSIKGYAFWGMIGQVRQPYHPPSRPLFCFFVMTLITDQIAHDISRLPLLSSPHRM